MNKEKAIEFVLEKLGISSFDGLSTSYDYIRQNDLIILSREFSDKPMYFKLKSLIEYIWEIEKVEKEIDSLMK